MATIRLKKEYLSFCFVIICLYLLFRFPSAVKNGVSEGLTICFYTIIPSLFPFMTLSSYISKSHIFSPFYKFFSIPVKKTFRQPPCTVPVIIMSMIGGFPVGIKMVYDLFSDGQITKKQAQKLCLFCMNAGPAFIITTVGINILHSMKAGIIMYISLCLSLLISGILCSVTMNKNEIIFQRKENIQLPLSSLSAAVSDSLSSILNICAWVILFSSLTNCVKTVIHNESVFFFSSALLEVTKGCTLIAGKTPLPIIAFLLGFGGFCVHFQVLGYLKSIGTKYYHFLLGRIFNGTLASIISYILFLVFPVETDVFSTSDKITGFTFSVSTHAFIIFVFMCIFMIFDIDGKRKV